MAVMAGWESFTRNGEGGQECVHVCVCVCVCEGVLTITHELYTKMFCDTKKFQISSFVSNYKLNF